MRLFFALLFVIATASPSSAQWVHMPEETAFSKRHMVATTNGDQFLAIMCEDKDLTIRLLVGEKWDPSYRMASVLARFAISIDGGEKSFAPVKLQQAGGMGDRVLLVVSDKDHVSRIAMAIRDARRSIDVALEMGGKFFNATRFSASGSNKVNIAIKECS